MKFKNYSLEQRYLGETTLLDIEAESKLVALLLAYDGILKEYPDVQTYEEAVDVLSKKGIDVSVVQVTKG